MNPDGAKINSHGVVVRCVYIPRYQNGFGFTLRHFIVYPPEVYVSSNNDGNNYQGENIPQSRLGQVTEPVDTIFVKDVKEHGPAAQAGLCVGDRVVSVNGEPIVGKSYDQVVQLIQTSASTLCLEVTPKQYDTLQLFYEEKAYRPETNQRPSSIAPPTISNNNSTYGVTTNSNHVVSIPVKSSLLVQQQQQHHHQQQQQLLQKPKHHHHHPTESLYPNYQQVPPPPRGKLNHHQLVVKNNHNFYHHYHQQQQQHPHAPGGQEAQGYGSGPLASCNSSYESVFLPDSHASLNSRGNMSVNPTFQSSSQQQLLPQQQQQLIGAPQQPKPSQTPPQLLSHLPRPTPYKSTVVWSHLSTNQQQQQAQQQQQHQQQLQQLHQQQQQQQHHLQQQHQQQLQQYQLHQQQLAKYYGSKSHQPQTYYPFNQRAGGVTRGVEVPSNSNNGPGSGGNNTQGSGGGGGAKSHESILAAHEHENSGGNRYGSMECLPTSSSGGMDPLGMGMAGDVPWKNIVGYRYSISTGPDIDYRRESTISLPPAAYNNGNNQTVISGVGKVMGGGHKVPLKDMGGFSLDYGTVNCSDLDPNTLGYEVKMVDRIRRSTEQKEEFLRRPPNQPMSWAPIMPNSAAAAGFPKELYAQPQKFQKVPWPPANVLSTSNGGGGNLQQSASTPTANSAAGSAGSNPNNNITRASSASESGRFADSVNQRSSMKNINPDGSMGSRGGEWGLSDYGSAKNRLTVVGSGKLHCDPPPDWKPPPSVIIHNATGGGISSVSGSHSHESSTTLKSNGGTTSNDETEYFLQNRNDADVILRKRESDPDYDNDRLVRRVSYLKATSSPIDMERKSSSPTSPTKSCDDDRIMVLPLPTATATCNVPSLRKSTTDPGTSPGRRRSMANKLSSDFLHKGRIVRLKQFFEERTQPSSLFKFHSNSPTTEFRHFGSFRSEKSPDDSEIIKDGPVHFKVRASESKKVGYYRSWRQGWAQIRRSGCLYLSKERITKDSISGMEENAAILCVGLKDGISIDPAEDYSKRKHVIRLKTCSSNSNSPGGGGNGANNNSSTSTSGPVQANVTLITSPNPNAPAESPSLLSQVEILLQAEDPSDMSSWLKALQQQQDNNNYYNSANNSSSNNSRNNNASASNSSATTELVAPKSSILKSISSGFQSVSSSSTTLANNHHLSVNQQHLSGPNPTSPKSKTWKSKVAKQLQKMHIPSGKGGSSSASGYNPQGSIPESGATFGVHLEDCPVTEANPLVPRVLEFCINTIETRGLTMVGIYRIPGNNAAVAALTDSLNKGNEPNPDQDNRWNDVHVISSMLKSFLRNLPDPLLTSEKYEEFIRIVSTETDDQLQLEKIKALIDSLPDMNFETLRFLILHLRKVSENSEKNRMESKNLSIVFGPTLVRPGENSVASMVQHMSFQCKLVELLINHAYEFFPPSDLDQPSPPVEPSDQPSGTSAATPVAIIPDPVAKFESDIRTSLIQAAQRKVSRQQLQPLHNTYGLPLAPAPPKSNERSIDESGLIRSYAGLGAETEQRVRQFELETRAMLTRDGRSPNPNNSALVATNIPTTVNTTGSIPNKSLGGQQGMSPQSNRLEEERRLEKLRLEAEWRKAKDDLENEDFYDQLADNPSSIVHHREHGLPPYTLLSHNVSSSSVSSSNSAGGTTADGSEVPSIVMSPNTTWPMKLGPTPFKPYSPSPVSTQSQHSTSPLSIPTLPPKPPYANVNTSISSSSCTKLTKTLVVTPPPHSPHLNILGNPLRKVSSVEQLVMPKHRQQQQGYQQFAPSSSSAERFDHSKVAGRETLKRLKKPENQTAQPYDPKLCGSLDSLRDIVNGGSREDISLRSSNGSDLVAAMSREYEEKLEALRPSLHLHKEGDEVEEEEGKETEGEANNNINGGIGRIESAVNQDDERTKESGGKNRLKKSEGEITDEVVPNLKDVIPSVKSNGFVLSAAPKGRSKSMIDRRRPSLEVMETFDKNSDSHGNKLASYRDPSLHRVVTNNSGGNDDSSSWVSSPAGEEGEETSLSPESQHGLSYNQHHHRESSTSLSKEAKTASNNRLTKECKRRHSLSGTADILRFMYEDAYHHKNLTHRLTTVSSSTHHPPGGNVKNLSNDALATALAANNILESHV